MLDKIKKILQAKKSELLKKVAASSPKQASSQGKTTKFKQRRYLSPRLILEETETLPITRSIIMAVALLLLMVVLWAAITHIDETAKVVGSVVPRGKIVNIQHLEGGTIRSVNVKNGERVIAHKTKLLSLDPIATKSELAELLSKELALLFDIERLRAFIKDDKQNVEQNLQAITKQFSSGLFTPEELQKSLADEMDLLAIQRGARADQRAVMQSQVEQMEQELKQLSEQKDVLERHIELLKREEKMYRNLNSISKRDFLEVLRQANKANGDLQQVVSKIKTNKIGVLEAKQRLQELDSKLKQDAARQLDEIRSQLAQVRKTILRVKDKADRLDIYSPVTGVVNDVQVVAGSVISPGNKLMEVVPVDRELIIEAKLSPRDVGHVRRGDDVIIKVTTYNSAVYGGLDGHVELVSANTKVEERQEPYYNVYIKPVKAYMGDVAGALPLMPGMTVEASIIIGQKTILGYLFKPIHRAFTGAFHER